MYDVDFLHQGSFYPAIAKNMSIMNHRGVPEPVTGPFKLFVPTALAGLANRLAKSPLLPQTSDNDQNWAGGRGGPRRTGAARRAQ